MGSFARRAMADPDWQEGSLQSDAQSLEAESPVARLRAAACCP